MQGFFTENSDSVNVESEKVIFNKQYEKLVKENGFNALTDFMFSSRENSFRDVAGRLTVGIDLDDNGAKQRVYLKRHWTLSKSKSSGPHKEALSEWNNINALSQAKIKVPDAMAVGHGFINGRSVGFIMMKEVPGKPADDFIKEDLFPLKDFKKRLRFTEDLALFSSEFHELGYNHRDFYLCHTFVNSSKSNIQLNLIDLQRVQKRSLFRKRWIVKDLAQMAYSALRITSKTDRLRFYLKYIGMNTLSGLDKKFIRSIERKVETMVKREGEGKVR
ncbi:MAG: hypothetical protein NE328_14805 [Lentisphaeraceae bacterium]|nr:hypothetical protein [Lentisphaeraceae bacterium]